MFSKREYYVVDPEYIADGLNAEFGIDRNIPEYWNNPNYLDAYNIMNTLSCEQEYGTSCYVEVYIGQDAIDDALDMLANCDKDNEWRSYYVTRARALKWLRNRVPLDHNRVLLAIDY